MKYRVTIKTSNYNELSFEFDDMEQTSVFIDTCLHHNTGKDFSCEPTLVNEGEEDARKQNGD